MDGRTARDLNRCIISPLVHLTFLTISLKLVALSGLQQDRVTTNMRLTSMINMATLYYLVEPYFVSPFGDMWQHKLELNGIYHLLAELPQKNGERNSLCLFGTEMCSNPELV